MPKNDKKIISFELPLDLYNRIKSAAELDDRTVSSYIRKMLIKAMKNHDWKTSKI